MTSTSTEMGNIDRRGGIDRREALRFRVTIDIEWEGEAGRRPGTTGDLSEQGCFVLCDGNVDDGTVIKLYLPLTDGGWTEFLATVTNHLYEVGFAAQFLGLTDAQKEFLENLLEHHTA